MKNKFLIIFIISIFSCNSNNSIDLDLANKVIIPKTYVVYKTSNPIKIDGKEGESDWEKAIFSDDFIDIEGFKIPKQKTNVKMLWDDKYLYIFAKLYEEHIWGDLTERDAVIFNNNDFEVFINPNDHVFSYGEIEINALGTLWDLFLNKKSVFDFKALLRLKKYIKKKEINVVHGPIRKGDIPHSLASIQKAKQLLNYSPSYSIQKGLEEAIEWYWNNLPK